MNTNLPFQTRMLEALVLPELRDFPDLLAVLDQGFTVRSDVMLFTAFEGSFNGHLLENLGDETGVEAFVNHLHLDDYLPAMPEDETLMVSLAFVRELGQRLLEHIPEHGFRIIVSLSTGHDGTIRFHRVRAGQVWTADGLDGYPEPIAVFEVRSVEASGLA